MSDNQHIFTPFTRKGVQYLAIPRDGGNVHIVTRGGHNMGAFQSIESFKKMYEAGECGVLGTVVLSVRPLS